MAWRLSGLEEVFPGMSAEQAAADRLYRKGSHEECVLKTQAFLGDTSAKVQSTTVSVQSPVCCFSLVHLGLAGTGLRESSGQCQHLPVASRRFCLSPISLLPLPILEANLKLPGAPSIALHAVNFLEKGDRHVPTSEL